VARKPSTRVVLNRAALTEVGLALADGFMEVGKTIVEVAAGDAPDSPYDPFPAGEGLPKQGGVLVYVEGAKVDGWSTRGVQPKIDRRTTDRRGTIAAVIGFGFPGRLAHAGTLKHRGDPFLLRAMNSVLPHIVNIMKPFVSRRLGSKP
jgi:hypothetical protein